MMKRITILFAVTAAAMVATTACGKGGDTTNPDAPKNAYVERVTIDGKTAVPGGTTAGVTTDAPVIEITFSAEIDIKRSDPENIFISGGTACEIGSTADPKTITLKITGTLDPLTQYSLGIDEGENLGVRIIDSRRYHFSTAPPSVPLFPTLSQNDLLTLVQRQTFKYFWDYAHPVSGLARERLGSGNTVTSGGSGFGLMAFPVAVERGFITRDEALTRAEAIVEFLTSKAERFHGAWSHWLDGATGKAIPFSANDNGADLVETAFLVQGLLVLQTYFDGADPRETALREAIQALWEGVEWDWFRRDGQNVLYWHWSPDREWRMNMQIRGWNECLIVYVLAASSPTHPIPVEVYDQGWARGGAMRNGRKFYDVTLPLGEDRGGPLFFSHYSFLGLDPRGLIDKYADYWEQNVAHAQINHKYCVANPRGWAGYSTECWGLTASDIPGGYTASSPSNDLGVIAPTAAIASMPYTPAESMAALEYFYYYLGGKLWGEYGFRDSFHLGRNWFAPSFLAIDQGPIVVMLENARTGLIWEIFMSRPDVRAGLDRLGFVYNF